MTNNTLIITIAIISAALIAAFTSIVLFYKGDSSIIIGSLTLLAGVIFAQLATFKSSTDNAANIATLDKKQDVNTAVTKDTFKLVDGQMAEFKRLMRAYAESEAARVGAEQKAEGIVIGQNMPVIDPDPKLAIDPALKQDVKPKMGDHR